ncbi:dephospho-CoA kinase [Rhizosphaericola mali]|uniref:Dephospho-CoA kinase n=1 Tax=Rhizosphaericola mali TaxID=2545455 RepID=A0A5P2G4B3_9BACT|nr:dephospho-CoA kinase [Rhizosphaericola mali]QES90037.1 dephospho-CoA kinase [Rhizosphaericola mali]
MLKIGLTGGIGSGKSTVAKIFQTLGIPVFDADTVAKSIMNENAELKLKIQQQFGDATYKDDVLDRAYLANIVFKDPYQLAILNSLVHPATIQAAEDWFQKQSVPYVIKEAALLFESGTAGNLDEVIGVYAPLTVRLARVKKRDNADIEAIKNRMKNQIEEEMKMKLCDRIIYNNDSEAILPQVLQLHKYYLQKSQQHV